MNLDELILKAFEQARGPLDTSDVYTLIEEAAGSELRLRHVFDRIREMATEGTLRVVEGSGPPLTYELPTPTTPNRSEER